MFRGSHDLRIGVEELLKSMILVFFSFPFSSSTSASWEEGGLPPLIRES